MLKRILRPEVAFILLGLAAAFLAHYATRWGPWAFSDATGYIVAARNLLAGHGLGVFDPSGRFSPGVSHPPFYVLCLALLGLFGPQPLVAARVLDVLLFALLVSMGGLLFFRATGSLAFGLTLSSLFLVHPAVLIAYLSAMSEPIFILAGLASLFMLALYLDRPRAAAFLGSSISAGLAFLTRYPGMAFAITGALALLFHRRACLKSRFRHALAYAAIAFAPTLAFLAWATSVPGAESPRLLRTDLEILPSLIAFVRRLPAIIWTWKPAPPAVLLPQALTSAAFFPILRWAMITLPLLAVVLLGIGAIRHARRRQSLTRSRSLPPLLLVFGLFMLMYLLLFAFAFVLTDPTPDVNSRTMLPLLPALLTIALAVTHSMTRAWPRRSILRPGLAVAILGSVLGYAYISQETIQGLHRTGLGYTGRDWRQSETIAAVMELPHGTPLISNEPSALLLLTHRTAYTIHEIAQRRPVEDFASFGSGPTEAERVFREQGAALVLFDTSIDQFHALYGEQADERREAFLAGLHVAFVGEDGMILFVDPSADVLG